MDQNTRLLFINLTCFTSFIIFWITFITTILYTYCWSYIEFWFETKLPITPYTLFVILFAIIAFWLIVELLITTFRKSFTLYKLSHFGICSVFLFLMTIFFINFNVHYNIENGKATPHDLLFKSDYFELFLSEPERFEKVEVIKVEFADGRQFPDIPDWDDYLYMQTCNKNIDITGLSQKQRNEIWKQYEEYMRKLYTEAGFDPDEYIY